MKRRAQAAKRSAVGAESPRDRAACHNRSRSGEPVLVGSWAGSTTAVATVKTSRTQKRAGQSLEHLYMLPSSRKTAEKQKNRSVLDKRCRNGSNGSHTLPARRLLCRRCSLRCRRDAYCVGAGWGNPQVRAISDRC